MRSYLSASNNNSPRPSSPQLLSPASPGTSNSANMAPLDMIMEHSDGTLDAQPVRARVCYIREVSGVLQALNTYYSSSPSQSENDSLMRSILFQQNVSDLLDGVKTFMQDRNITLSEERVRHYTKIVKRTTIYTCRHLLMEVRVV